MTRFLYADEVWEEITKAVLESSRTRAAVAYVTQIEALPLKSGDVLVADASDLAIASGQTSANAIETLVDGCHCRLSRGLHAKVVIADSTLFTSSANASGSSLNALFEAALKSDNPI